MKSVPMAVSTAVRKLKGHLSARSVRFFFFFWVGGGGTDWHLMALGLLGKRIDFKRKV